MIGEKDKANERKRTEQIDRQQKRVWEKGKRQRRHKQGMERNHTEMRESKKERSQSKSRGDVDGEDGGEELNEEKQSEHTTRLTLLTHSVW